MEIILSFDSGSCVCDDESLISDIYKLAEKLFDLKIEINEFENQDISCYNLYEDVIKECLELVIKNKKLIELYADEIGRFNEKNKQEVIERIFDEMFEEIE